MGRSRGCPATEGELSGARRTHQLLMPRPRQPAEPPRFHVLCSALGQQGLGFPWTVALQRPPRRAFQLKPSITSPSQGTVLSGKLGVSEGWHKTFESAAPRCPSLSRVCCGAGTAGEARRRGWTRGCLECQPAQTVSRGHRARLPLASIWDYQAPGFTS